MTIPVLVCAKALTDFRLELSFENGEVKIYNFTPNLSHPAYKALSNHKLFTQVSVHEGEIEWVTGQDFCPHTLYLNSKSII